MEGARVEDYVQVQDILIGTVSPYIIFLAIIGPECVLILLLYMTSV